MAGSGTPDVHLSSPASRGFSASPVDGDAYGESHTYSSPPRFDTSPYPSSSRQVEKQDAAGSSNFINVLKERVRSVLDAPHSSARVSRVGSVSQPTTSTELVSQNQPTAHSSYGATAGPSHRPDLQVLPLQTGREPVVVDSGSDRGVRSAQLEDYYSIDWVPKELFLKFRQQVEGFQIGANFEFDGLQVKEYNTKFVLKPVQLDRKWKFICEPKHGDLRLLTKKIPIGPLLNIQVGIGHEWHTHTTGWKWKVTSAFGGSSHTHIRHKTLFPLTPGFDLRVGWNAEYVLPDLHGALGTGDPTIGFNLGHLYASVERVEAIYTHMT